MDEPLRINLSGIEMRNPMMLASGIMGSYASSLNRMSEFAGAVITKSVGVQPVEGYRNPAVINYSHGLINAVGLASPGAKAFADELRDYVFFAPLIVSLFGSKPEEFAGLVKHFPFADGFELNLSCPHAENVGLAVGSDPEMVYDIVRAVKGETEKPIFAKLSPNVRDIVEIGKAAEDARADGIVAINTLKGMKIDVFAKKPILSNVSGGVSGEGIKPIAIKCVWDLYEELEIPIVGSGGVTSWKDIVEFMLAGASAVQIGSALYYSNRVFYSLKESLIAYTRMTGERLEDIIGMAHRN